jgi:hypothetical protein
MFPVFPPEKPYPLIVVISHRGSMLLTDPARQGAALTAFLSSLGAALVVALVYRRELARYLANERAWAYYAAAHLFLALCGGADYDRFALWLAPPILIGLACSEAVRRISPSAWAALAIVHAISMNLMIPWYSSEAFFDSRNAALARGSAYGCISVGVIALVVVTLSILRHDRLRTQRASLVSRGSPSSPSISPG